MKLRVALIGLFAPFILVASVTIKGVLIPGGHALYLPGHGGELDIFTGVEREFVRAPHWVVYFGAHRCEINLNELPDGGRYGLMPFLKPGANPGTLLATFAQELAGGDIGYHEIKAVPVIPG